MVKISSQCNNVGLCVYGGGSRLQHGLMHFVTLSIPKSPLVCPQSKPGLMLQEHLLSPVARGWAGMSLSLVCVILDEPLHQR